MKALTLAAVLVVLTFYGAAEAQTVNSPLPQGPAQPNIGPVKVLALPSEPPLLRQEGAHEYWSNSCDSCCTECCPQPCGPSGRIWAQADALLWWINGAKLPPLITMSVPGTSLFNAGVLGTPGTTTVFGDSTVNNGVRFGGRFAAGAWLDCEQTIGIEGYFFGVGGDTKKFQAGSADGSTIVARPFFDVSLGLPNSELVSFPGIVSGSVLASAKSSGLIGTGALMRQNLCCGCCYRVDALAGYRYLSFSDQVGISENLTSIDPTNVNIPVGTNLMIADSFKASNVFNGFDFGLSGEYRRGPWVLDLLAKAAVGQNREVVEINGSRIVTVPGGGPPDRNVGGLYALASNIGRYSRESTVVIPEFEVKVGYQITPHLRAFAGYNLLYWANVARAGDQIDTRVNPNLLPPIMPPVAGPNLPAFKFDNTSIWAQGVSLGLELRF